MENTAGAKYENFDNWDYATLKQSTFKGRKTYRGKPTKSYLKHLKENPSEIHDLGNKVINPDTGRLINKDKLIDRRFKKSVPKEGKNYDLVDGKLTNKPSSKKVIQFKAEQKENQQGDYYIATPNLENFDLNNKSVGVKWFKIFLDGKQVGEGQIDFTGIGDNNRVDLFKLFMRDSDTSYLIKNETYTIEMYNFNEIKFNKQKLPQVYADNKNKICIFEPVKEYIEKSQGTKKKERNLKTINNLIQKYPNGITPEDIQTKICNTMSYSVVIMTPTNKIIEELKPKGDRIKKTFYYINSEINHAEGWTYADFRNEKETITFNTAEEMNNKYVSLENNNEIFTFKKSSRIQGFNGVCSIETKDRKYVIEDPTKDLKEELFNDYNDVFTTMECEEKDYNGSVMDFIFRATYVNGLRTFENKGYGKYIKEHDIEKAYATFYKCDYYKDYGIPSIPTDFRNCEKIDTLTVINKTGWTQIKNIKGEGNAFKLADLKEYWVYPNVELKCLYDLGVRFDCIKSAWCLEKKDFRFPDEFLQKVDHPDFKSQKYYAIIVGMMLSCSTTEKFYYHYSKEPSQEWIDNLAYHDDKLKMVYHCIDNNNLIFERTKNKVKSSCHVSSYITAYVRTRMYKEIEKRDINDIIMVNSDALKFKGDYELPLGFKDKSDDVWLSDENFKQYHNEKIAEQKFRVDKWKDQGQFVFYNGAGGCGKTTTYMNTKFPYKVLTMPTNELKAEKSGDIDCYTHHNFFKLPIAGSSEEVECRGLTEYEYYGIGEVFVDEITMRTKNETDLMIKHAKKYGYRLIFVGDIDFETMTPYQLQPVKSKFSFDKSLFTVENYTKNYRITNKNFLDKVNDVRKLMRLNMDKDISNQLWLEGFNKIIVDYFKERIFDEKYMIDNFNPEKDLIITGKNKNKNTFNNIFDEKCEKKIYKMKRKVDKYEKGMILYEDELKINTKCKELCFATSIHGVQGKTWTGNLYVNVKDIFEFGMLYTAISRVRSVEQLFLIN